MTAIPRIHRPREDAPVKARGVIHKLVADTAKDFARAYYEGAARNNEFYKEWPSSDGYVAAKWQSFIRFVRESFAEMLQMPDGVVSPDDKSKIYDALKLNAAANPAANHFEQTLH